MHPTLPRLERYAFPALTRRATTTLQVNLGYKCNQTCFHCHVNAGPNRTEMMDGDTVDLVIAVLERRRMRTLDVTGGAPEMSPHFRRLVSAARALGVEVIDRCNLTILSEPGHEDTADFLAREGVRVVASLPCYLEDNVDAQRGKGVFDASIRGLQMLNALGYGRGKGLELDLVFNPQGPNLPPAQVALESAYKRHLKDKFGIVFDKLFTLANMPIQRFGATLITKGTFDGYMDVLLAAHNDDNLDNVMCRDLVSVDYNGRLHDCDFNQMLNLDMGEGKMHLRDLLKADIAGHAIRTAGHCFGCTAGQGSSCGGALVPEEPVREAAE